MLLITHIVIALGGLALAVVSYFAPSLTKIKILACTTSLTLLSGTLLVLQLHSSLTSACLSGLAYLGIALTSMGLSYKKLAKVHSNS